MRFADLDSCLEGGLIYPLKEIAYTSIRINPSINIVLEVLYLLEDILVAGNVHLEVVGLEFPLALKRTKLLLKLPGMALGKTLTIKHKLEFLGGRVDILHLVELIGVGLGMGHFHNDLAFGAHCRINDKLGGSEVRHGFKKSASTPL